MGKLDGKKNGAGHRGQSRDRQGDRHPLGTRRGQSGVRVSIERGRGQRPGRGVGGGRLPGRSHACDVKSKAAADALVSKIVEAGAGSTFSSTTPGSSATLVGDDDRGTMARGAANNLDSVFNFCQAVTPPDDVARSGRIVNMSSVAANHGNKGSGELRGQQRGDRRIHPLPGHGTRQSGCDGQRHRAGLHRNRHDGCGPQRVRGRDQEAHSTERLGQGADIGARWRFWWERTLRTWTGRSSPWTAPFARRILRKAPVAAGTSRFQAKQPQPDRVWTGCKTQSNSSRRVFAPGPGRETAPWCIG